MDKDATKLDELTNDQIRLRLAEFGYEKKFHCFPIITFYCILNEISSLSPVPINGFNETNKTIEHFLLELFQF